MHCDNSLKYFVLGLRHTFVTLTFVIMIEIILRIKISRYLCYFDENDLSMTKSVCLYFLMVNKVTSILFHKIVSMC